MALAALIPSYAVLALVMQWNMRAAWACLGVSTMISGAVCVYFGQEWNEASPGYHMMYWIPLEIWGWLWIVLGIVFVILAIGGWV